MEKKYDVFISCKSEDYSYAEKVSAFLRKHDLTPFLASESLRRVGNTAYLDEIDKALDECQHLIVFCTKPEYADSKFVKEEWQSFRNEKLSGRKDGNILTIVADNISIGSLPYGLRRYEVIRLSEYERVLLNYLVETINKYSNTGNEKQQEIVLLQENLSNANIVQKIGQENLDENVSKYKKKRNIKWVGIKSTIYRRLHRIRVSHKSVISGTVFIITFIGLCLGLKIFFSSKTFTLGDVSFKMIKVDGGSFSMGATSEMKYPNKDQKPSHKVMLDTYYICETEVTQALWKAVMGDNPSYRRGDYLPVNNVSREDCLQFIKKLNKRTGMKFRLPTEAEWEFAARGGNKSRHYQYSGSNNLGEVAWYERNSKNKIHAVKTKKANELGLYDMSGNVWEWCQDFYGSYGNKAQTNPKGPRKGRFYVSRGGCFYSGDRYCYSSFRCAFDSSWDHGFRLALSE